MSKNDSGYAGVTTAPISAVWVLSCVYGVAGMVAVRLDVDFDLAMMIAGVPGIAMLAGGCVGACRSNGRIKLTSLLTAIGVVCTSAAYGATSLWLGTSAVCGSSSDVRHLSELRHHFWTKFHFAHFSGSTPPPPHAPCTMLYLVPVLLGR